MHIVNITRVKEEPLFTWIKYFGKQLYVREGSIEKRNLQVVSINSGKIYIGILRHLKWQTSEKNRSWITLKFPVEIGSHHRCTEFLLFCHYYGQLNGPIWSFVVYAVCRWCGTHESKKKAKQMISLNLGERCSCQNITLVLYQWTNVVIKKEKKKLFSWQVTMEVFYSGCLAAFMEIKKLQNILTKREAMKNWLIFHIAASLVRD